MRTLSRCALFAALLTVPFGADVFGQEAVLVRHGVKIPVEGKVAPVKVGDVAWPENFRPTDADGWSTFQPTPDVRILYVSAAGDDDSAVAYEPGSAAVGADPFRPAGEVKTFRSINTALGKQRPGMPDWVLLKRGDTFRGPITEQAVPPGKSEGSDEELYARFFAEARTMRRGAWRKEFTTRAINGYFREGFGMEHLAPDKLPPVLCGPYEPRFSCSK